jgi:hypothetical protein
MLRQIELGLARLARRKRLAVAVVGLTPLVLRLALSPWAPAPDPRVQDEFSHLLAADTFAHGRATNPVHPLWVHFESMHILVRPVYASVFPPGNGLAMAVGQALTGRPWPGVWLSVGVMCAALCWMLQGWVSPGWALLGGVLAAVRFGVSSYWINSYYGGAVAAAGGALALGALPRVVRRGRWSDAAWMGVGLAILAATRPYEGLLLGAPLLAALAWKLRGRLARAIPLAAILCVAAAALGWYNTQFSGNPFQLPYAFYRGAFTMAPHFVWQSPRPEPVYHHRALRDFHTVWEMGCYRDAQANRSPHGIADKAKTYVRFYWGPFLGAAVLLALPRLWRRRRTRLLLLLGGLLAVGLAVEVWDAPHYAAPATGLALLVAVEALRHLRQWAGRWPVRGLALVCLATPIVGGGGHPGDGSGRARVMAQLEAAGGRHVVVVRYRATHEPGDEWVYNAADIDRARVVWAREMDPTSNRKLARYFQDRRLWLVEPDARPPRLSPYDPSMPPDPPFRFVKLGDPAIEVLRSREEVRQKMLRNLQESGRPQPWLLNCHHWNYIFHEVTGVAGPLPNAGCPENAQISLDEWLAWADRQR